MISFIINKALVTSIAILIVNYVNSQSIAPNKTKFELPDSIQKLILSDVKKMDTFKNKETVMYYFDEDSVISKKNSFIFGIFILKFRIKLFHTLTARIPVFWDIKRKSIQYNISDSNAVIPINGTKILNRYKFGLMHTTDVVYVDRMKKREY